MLPREEQLAENQQMSRGANERLQQVLDGQVTGLVAIPFLCECADVECRGRIEMTTSDYEAAHILRNQYVILPGHAMTDGERVVEEASDGYLLVQKS
jgi:hypothetical protein